MFALGVTAAVASGQKPATLQPVSAHRQTTVASAAGTAPPDAAQAVISRTCLGCHNDRALSGNLSLAKIHRRDRPQNGETAERMIRKLRAGQMPPPGSRRPEETTLIGLAAALEAQVDAQRVGRRARPPDLSAAQSRRVHAIGSRPARPRRQRRRLPAARRQERQLRQHRRRADAVADIDAGLPHGGGRDQPARRRRPRRDGARSDVPGVALDVAARAHGGHAVRHARRAGGRAHVPGRRRVPVPRVLLSRDHRRPLRQRARRAAHRRGARAGRDRRSTAPAPPCSTSTAG